MKVKNLNAFSEFSLLRPFQGFNPRGRRACREQLACASLKRRHCRPSTTGQDIHGTRIGKAWPARTANHIPEYSQIIKVLN